MGQERAQKIPEHYFTVEAIAEDSNAHWLTKRDEYVNGVLQAAKKEVNDNIRTEVPKVIAAIQPNASEVAA